MKKTALIPLFVLLIASTIIAQQHQEESRAAASSELYASDVGETLPTKSSLKETWFIPEQQTGVSSTSHAVANAITLSWVRNSGAYSIDEASENRFSQHYIQSLIKDDCEQSVRILEALELIKKQGIVFTKDFITDGNCDTQPDKSIQRKALQHRIKDHLLVFAENEPNKVFFTKKQLHNNHPVIVQINIPDSFKKVKSDIKTFVNTNKNLPTSPHSVCVVGYNDGREAFEVMSSLGRNWANKGYIWLKYEDFDQMATEGYIAIPGDGSMPIEEEIKEQTIVKNTPEVTPRKGKKKTEKKHQNTINLEGKFAFRFLDTFDEQNKPVFKSVRPVFDNGSYVLREWNTKNRYQLLGTDMTPYSYTYVFSVDSQNKAELHFPATDLDAADVVPLKPIVPDETSYMTIPDEQSALQSVQKGIDHICVIYSHHEIIDIQSRIEQVKQDTQEDFKKRLDAGFRDILIPLKDIQYTDNMMGFIANSTAGTAVPILLNIMVD